MTGADIFPGDTRGWAILVGAMIGTLLLGFGASVLGGTNVETPWYRALTLPAWQPPGWAFPVAWSILYPVIGYAAGRVLLTDVAGTAPALVLWGAQLALNLAWSLVFFGEELIVPALVLLVAILGLAILTTLKFGAVATPAAWAMVPYLLWLSYASVLNLRVWMLNPGA